ncbi:hypothetical protein [Jiangella anatolica]|uniref:Uncharacterized protein n=1 Tax=Jiangella anatolica TaxID=2670374 RepID=A0A2W2BWK2_9ACTN|nr:hypothetical protein [Jiangella anatolica]PZF84814.1 hypothetical protein C1I92_07035 [Jiangella anatolica]
MDHGGTSTERDANLLAAAQISSIDSVSRYGDGIGVGAAEDDKALYVYGNKPGARQQSGFGI